MLYLSGVDESSLTGESATIYKQPPSHTETGRNESNNRDNTNRGPSDIRSQGSADRKMPSGDVSRAVLYGGSLVKLGEGTGVVTATGKIRSSVASNYNYLLWRTIEAGILLIARSYSY